MAVWYTFWSFGTFPHFGMFGPRKIWQPWKREREIKRFFQIAKLCFSKNFLVFHRCKIFVGFSTGNRDVHQVGINDRHLSRLFDPLLLLLLMVFVVIFLRIFVFVFCNDDIQFRENAEVRKMKSAWKILPKCHHV
jgi:hypothetical protein